MDIHLGADHGGWPLKQHLCQWLPTQQWPLPTIPNIPNMPTIPTISALPTTPAIPTTPTAPAIPPAPPNRDNPANRTNTTEASKSTSLTPLIHDHGALTLDPEDHYPTYGHAVARAISAALDQPYDSLHNSPQALTPVSRAPDTSSTPSTPDTLSTSSNPNTPSTPNTNNRKTLNINSPYLSTWGILLCRTGAGMTIVANRYRGVRAVVCRQERDVRLARAHNDANILVLEGDYLSLTQAQELVQLFWQTPFAEGRHAIRVQQIDAPLPY